MILAQLPVEEADSGLSGLAADPTPVLEALDCLRVAVTLYDSDLRLIYANRHFRYIFRALPDAHALIGRPYGDIVRMELDGGEIDQAAYPDGIDAYVARRCLQFRADDYAPRDIPFADGRIIEIKIRAAVEGGWIALWSDVTQARHAYGRLASAVEMSADAFAFWDRDDRLVLWNPGFALLHGSGAADDLTGMTFAEMLERVVTRGMVEFASAEEAARWVEKRQQAHRAPAGAATVRMKNGEAYLVRERATRDGGRATVYTDVTDRHRVETAFAEQNAALKATQHALDRQSNYLADLTLRLDKAEEGASAAKTTFLRTMSHELKTPLNAIIGFSDLLKTAGGKFGPEQVSEYAELIHRAGGNLLTMLNQILDLTKIAAGRYPITREAVPARVLFDRAYDGVIEAAEDKTIRLDVPVCPADLAASGDENALAAMVVQLARNAVAFTQNGGTVRLEAAREGTRLFIRVIDDGPGIDAKDLARIVEPFEQGGRDTAAHNGGAGLGLPLVKALAELQGGSLALDSSLGEGFTATLDLPAA